MNRDDIVDICPGLAGDPHFQIASPHDEAYNCFAWAAEDSTQIWDPLPEIAPTRAAIYWPEGVPLLYTTTSYIQAFETVGYEECADAKHEPGFTKIALYESETGEPLHAARQLASGIWTSKLGAGKDIEHGTPEGVSNLFFGKPARYLRRSL